MVLDKQVGIRLTSAQSSIWYAQQLDPDTSFDIAYYVDLHGHVDVEILAAANADAAAEFGVSAMRMVTADDQPRITYSVDSDLLIATVDLRSESDSVAAGHRWIAADLSVPMKLDNSPLVHIHILVLDIDRYFLYTRAHHIAVDGYAATMLLRRTASLYMARTMGRPEPCSTAEPVDVVMAEDDQYRSSPRFDKDRAYWTAITDNLPPAVTLAAVTPGTSTRAILSRSYVARGSLTLETENALAAAEQRGRMRSAIIVAAFHSFIARMTDRDDLVLSLPVAARTNAHLRRSAGSLSNVVPIRLAHGATSTIDSAVDAAQTALSGALRHQRYRREDIGRDAAQSATAVLEFGPVVNLMLFDQNLSLGDIIGDIHVLTTGPVADLAVNVYNGTRDQPSRVDFETNPARYSAADADPLHERFMRYLGQFARAAGFSETRSLEIFLDHEREKFVPAMGPDPVAPATLRSLLTSGTTGDVADHAVTDGVRSIGYQELGQLSDRLAVQLQSAGVGPETTVAVLIPRSIESVVAFWAVAKTGAGHVPIDPSYPQARIDFMLGDCMPHVAITTDTSARRIPGGLRSLTVDMTTRQPATTPFAPTGESCAQIAYVIYTSGSTGTPKGVGVTHNGLANLVQQMRDTYSICSSSRVLHYASPSFDTAVVEIVAAAVHGATLVICPPRVYGGAELADILRAEKITHLFSTPSALTTVDQAGLPDLSVVLMGGETCTTAINDRWSADRTVMNAYGPTETTCSVTMTRSVSQGEYVTIGYPMRGVGVVILDKSFRPMPPGSNGEMYLSGAALARGYMGRPATSALRFVANPFGPPGSRMFRSGDRGRFTPSGDVTFLGRTDAQVKIRGIRIEPAEIDARLKQHASVSDAITVVRSAEDGSKALASYVGVHSDSPATSESIRTFVRASLPEHLVPASVTLLSALPLTTNKKVDLSALPDPVFARTDADGAKPESMTEHRIAKEFETVLGVDDVGVDRSFFDLGGNSLSATRIVGRLNRECNADISVRDVFDAPTVAALALVIDSRAGSRSNAPQIAGAANAVADIPLAPAQVFIDRSDAAALHNIPFTIRIRGELDDAALRDAMSDVIERHASLRTIFPDGTGQRVLTTASPPALHPTVIDEDGLDCAVDTFVSAGFDVRRDIPIRAELLRLSADQHVVVCVLHHIAADGWSLAPLARDLVQAYVSRSSGMSPDWNPPNESPTRVTYADYAVWAQQQDHRADIDYWRSQLADADEPLALPTDRERTNEWTFRGARANFRLGAYTHRDLLSAASRHSTGLLTIIRSMTVAVLAYLSGDTDIRIGTPIANRQDPTLESVVGMFVNTLVYRDYIAPTTTFDHFIDVARSTELDALHHCGAQFEDLVAALEPSHGPAHHPFFQVALSLNNFVQATLDVDGLEFTIEPRALDIAKCDLHFHVTERTLGDGSPAGIDVELVYSTDLFEEARIQEIVELFEDVVEATLVRPRITFSDLFRELSGQAEDITA